MVWKVSVTYNIMIYQQQWLLEVFQLGLNWPSDQMGWHVSERDPKQLVFSVLMLACIPFWMVIHLVKKSMFLG